MKRHVLLLTILIVSTSAGPGRTLVTAPTTVPGVSDRVAAMLDSMVPVELVATGTPGAAVAVVIGDRLAYAKGFGVASIETRVPVTPDMLFRIASTSKVLTAAAVLAASARGMLTLDEPASRTLPDLSPSFGRLTLRTLLAHRAGLREGSSYYGPQDEAALHAFVRSWSDEMLFTEPGDIYSYSNLGYVLAGDVLAQASGKSYADAMHDLLFAPLGMRHTTLRPTEAMTYAIVQGHEPGPDGHAVVVRPFSNDARYWPAGSVFTSALELARFVSAVLNRGRLDGVQVLPASMVDTLLSRQTDMAGDAPREQAGYAFGLVMRERQGIQIYQHGGARIGFGSLVRIIPARRIGIVILANRTNGLLLNTLEHATGLLVPGYADAGNAPPGSSMLSVAEIDRAVGRYVNTPGDLELELVARGDELWLRNPCSPKSEAPVRKTSDGRYRASGQIFALTAGSRGQARYLVIAGHALRKR